MAKAPGADIPAGSAQVEEFAGPHPAGLPGTHIHHLAPVSGNKTVWTVGYQDVIAIGKLFADGKLYTNRVVALGGPQVDKDAPTVSVTFLQPDETLKVVDARVGESFLQTAHRHDIDLEGACEGVCACSTCHLILPHDMYDSLPNSVHGVVALMTSAPKSR